MVRKRACRIFVFFLALVVLVNVSFSFEGLNNGHFLVGNVTKAASVNYYYDKYNVSYNKEIKYNNTLPDTSNGEQYLFNNGTWSYWGTSLYYKNDYNDPGIVITGQDRVSVGEYGWHATSYTNSSVSRFYLTRVDSYYNYYGYWAGSAELIDVLKKTLVQANIIAADGTYPNNGIHTDGYWYVKKTISITFPTQNQIVSQLKICAPSITVSNANGDTLTCKYYIDDVLMDTKPAFNTANPQTVYFNAPDLSNIAEGNRKIKFEVSVGTAAPITQTVDVIVDKSAPNITTFNIKPDVQSLNITAAASDSFSGLKDKPYLYYINDSCGDWTSEKTCPKTGLIPNTKYKVAVEAADNGNNVAKQEKFIYTIPQAPQLSVNNIKENSMDININDSNPSPIKYEIKVGSSYVNAAGALTSLSQLIEPTNKKITVTGLLPNKQYSIQAKAINGAETGAVNCGAESGLSSVTETTLAQPPANIRTESNLDSIIISWDAVSNAKGYEISVDGDDAKCTNVGTSTTYTHSSLMPDSYHHYKVRTINMEGAAGPWSSEIIASTLPNPPDAPTITSTETTYSAITINWGAVAGATGYDIQIDDDMESKDVGLETTYPHKGLTPGSAHKYRVRAKIKRGEKVVEGKWSELMEVSTPPLPPEIPTNFKGVSAKDNITLTWSAADRAEGYELEVDGSSYDLKAITKYIHDGLAVNSRHIYKIRAYNGGGRSAWSSQQEITTWPEIPATPTNIMATSEKDSITVTWYSSPFAESYDIQVDGNNTVNVKELSYTQKDLTAGTKHSYRLRAKNITGDGQWSNPIEISTLPEETATTSGGAISLTNIAAVVTNKSVTIAWQAAKAKVQYQVEVDGKIFDNGKDTVYNHTGLKPQSFHTYRVRTVDADGNGQWCAILALSTLPDLPGAPANLNAKAYDTQIELSWTKEDGVAYEVEADGVVKNAGEEAGYPDTGLKPGTTHTYRVRGINITGATAWSNSITKSTTSPSYEVECKKDTAFNFSLLASNVDYFGGMSFVVKYNPEQLEVQDLCDFTTNNDTSSGKIPGTNLTVTYTPGRIVFSVDESVAPGQNWSGEISTIIFKSKIDGKAGINYSIE